MVISLTGTTIRLVCTDSIGSTFPVKFGHRLLLFTAAARLHAADPTTTRYHIPMSGSISAVQFGDRNPSITANKQSVPESERFDGPGGLDVSGEQNKLAANANTPLPKPGFSN